MLQSGQCEQGPLTQKHHTSQQHFLQPPLTLLQQRRHSTGSAGTLIVPTVPKPAPVLAPLRTLGTMPIVFRPKGALKATDVKRRVLCYGDSLTAGLCEEGRQFEPYGRHLAEELAFAGAVSEVFVCGLSGHTAAEMVRELDFKVAGPDMAMLTGKGLRCILGETRQDLVLIMAGTNDLGRGVKPPKVLEEVCRLHVACHAMGVPTVVIAPPPLAPRAQGRPVEQRKELTELLSAWAKSTSGVAAFINPGLLLGNAAASHCYDPDGLHFSPAGSKRVGEWLAALVAPILLKSGKAPAKERAAAPCAPM